MFPTGTEHALISPFLFTAKKELHMKLEFREMLCRLSTFSASQKLLRGDLSFYVSWYWCITPHQSECTLLCTFAVWSTRPYPFFPPDFFFFWSVEEKKGNNYLIFSGERKKSIAIAKNALNRDQNKLIVLYKWLTNSKWNAYQVTEK